MDKMSSGRFQSFGSAVHTDGLPEQRFLSEFPNRLSLPNDCTAAA
jgi:hypothetical protein